MMRHVEESTSQAESRMVARTWFRICRLSFLTVEACVPSASVSSSLNGETAVGRRAFAQRGLGLAQCVSAMGQPIATCKGGVARWGMWHLAWSPAPIPTIHSLHQANSPPASSDSMNCAASHALVIMSSWDVW
eukprot:1754198-Prymnesium_polylepis.2